MEAVTGSPLYTFMLNGQIYNKKYILNDDLSKDVHFAYGDDFHDSMIEYYQQKHL